MQGMSIKTLIIPKHIKVQGREGHVRVGKVVFCHDVREVRVTKGTVRIGIGCVA